MDEGKPTKTCRLCYMQIDARAKKCPYCRQWQHLLFLVTLPPQVEYAVLLGIVALSMGTLLLTAYRIGRPPEDFTKHAHELSVAESRMDLWELDGALHLSIVGKLKNDSSLPWQDAELECQFYDAEGRLVDVMQAEHSGTVPARGEAFFSLSLDPDLPREAYAQHKVVLRFARDARSRW